MQYNPRHSVWALLLALCFLATIPGCASTRSQEQAPDPAMAEQLAFQDLGMSYQKSMKEHQPAKAREAAEQLFAIEPQPWVQVLLAMTWAAEENRDEAFPVLSAAIASIARSPIDAGPIVVDLARSLESGDEWTSLRSDPRFPALLAQAKAATWHPEPLAFDAAPATDPVRMKRPATDSETLRTLRETYKLDAVVAGAADDLDRVRRMCRWVHARTSHQGWDGDLPSDALGLLQVADKGGQWRCVEYGIVMAGCLNAVGIPARQVGGQARDVETIALGAGHVFAEAWLADRQRWVFVDAQMDIVGLDSDGTPMNSVEFRNSLSRPNPPIPYPLGLAFCMNYFATGFEVADGKESSIMLGPIGSKMPTKFQRVPSRAPDHFTHRLTDMYAPPEPAAPTSVETNANLQDFDFVTEKLRINYAGWDTKVTDATRPKLEALTAKLRAEAATAAPERFTEILREWLAFFGDRHIGAFPLSVEQPSPAEAAAAATRTPTLDWTEASVRARVAELGERRDPLEGIWNISDRYRIGVLRTPGKEGMFTAVVLTTVAEGWSPGQVKAEFTRLKNGTIEMLFRAGDHSETRQPASLLLDGAMLRSDRWGAWVREYPASAVPLAVDIVDRISPSDSMFLRPLSDKTMWLRLPDFDSSRATPLKEILAANEARLASCPNLLIDLRSNGGGSDFVYGPIMPMLYTRPIYGISVEMRVTADNLALRKRVADELRVEAPEVAKGLDEQNALMERNIGGWIRDSVPFSIERMDGVLPFPKRVAILIDGAGSSGEQFLLEARQSRKVTLFGQRNSAGVLDFANVVHMDTPSGRYGMYWATSRSLRLPDDPVDPDGIPPDIRIPEDAVDPVGFAQAWLERQVD